MPNILDYLDWRGDISFAADPFNEVDGLILAQLSYIIFDNILSDSFDTSMTIKEAYKLYDPKKIDENLVFYSFNEDMKLLEKLSVCERFSDIRLTGYINRTNTKEALQFSAVTCILPNGTNYVSFRGTDGTIAGWREDFNFSFMTGTPAQICAAEYLDNSFKTSDRLILGGHSKGANLAIYAAVFCKAELENSIEKVYAFDGPGFREEVTETERYKKMSLKITAIVPRYSIIGQLLDINVDNKIVNSSEHGILQHFAYSWQVKRNRFDYAEQFSKTGTYINKVMDAWFSELDDNTRKVITDSLFDVIEAADIETLKEIQKHKFSSYTAILKAIAKLPKERQKITRHAFFMLFETGRETLKEEIEDAAQNIKFEPPQINFPIK